MHHNLRIIDEDALYGRLGGRARGSSDRASPGFSALLVRRLEKHRGVLKSPSLGARLPFDTRQRATVKVHYFRHSGGGAAALKAHVRYIGRESVAQSAETTIDPVERKAEEQNRDQNAAARERSSFYDALTDDLDGVRRAQAWASKDRRHFRLILSAENGAELGDLKAYTREVMARAEIALGTRLEWVAVDHWDTDNPHTHIVLRGRHEDGRDLVIPRDYVSHGFREAARDVATARLGERSRSDERLALGREARAHRPTRLDTLIAEQVDSRGRIQISHLRAPNGSPDLTQALKARSRELVHLGLATQIGRTQIQFSDDWRDRLKAMEMHLDVRKNLMRSRMPRTPSIERKGVPVQDITVGGHI